jgi:hypothetical protein
MHQPRKKQRIFGKKYKGKKFKIMMKPTGSKSKYRLELNISKR